MPNHPHYDPELNSLSGELADIRTTPEIHIYPVVVACITVLLGICTVWLLQNGYVNDEAIDRWSKVLQVFDANKFRIEHFSFLYPHFPVYISSLFYPIPGLRQGAVPYAASVLTAGILILIWMRTLIRRGVGLWKSLLLLILMLANPIFLWAITSGNNLTMTMLVFYFIFLSFLKIVEEHFLRAYLVLAIALGFYFFIDGMAFFLFIALLPLMAFAAPDRIYEDSPISFYLILGFPFALFTLAWAYINWLFHTDPWAFIHSPESAYLGGKMLANKFLWLREYGGSFFAPMGTMLVVVLISHPIILFFLYENRKIGRRMWSSAIMFLHPIVAAGFATSYYYLDNPLDIMVLISASIMAETAILAKTTQRHFVIICTMLLLNIPGSWWVFHHFGNDDTRAWNAAIMGQGLETSALNDGDFILGRFLAQTPYHTMMDEKSANRVIAAKGNGEKLILSFTDQFKISMHHSIPDVPQLAVPDLRTTRGKLDLLNQHFGSLYQKGMTGYHLVYDQGGWRVYRRNGISH